MAQELTLEPTPHPTRVWVGFFFAWEKHRPGTMEQAYGWEHPPLGLRPLESVFTVYHRAHDFAPDHPLLEPVGWVSLTKNPQSFVMQSLSLGLLPQFTGLGYRRRILMAASTWAFEHNDAEVVTAEVFDSNAEQQRAYMRDAERGFPFRPSGYVWHPYGYRLFTRVKSEPEAVWIER